jgi:hypothetical protein
MQGASEQGYLVGLPTGRAAHFLTSPLHESVLGPYFQRLFQARLLDTFDAPAHPRPFGHVSRRRALVLSFQMFPQVLRSVSALQTDNVVHVFHTDSRLFLLILPRTMSSVVRGRGEVRAESLLTHAHHPADGAWGVSPPFRQITGRAQKSRTLRGRDGRYPHRRPTSFTGDIGNADFPFLAGPFYVVLSSACHLKSSGTFSHSRVSMGTCPPLTNLCVVDTKTKRELLHRLLRGKSCNSLCLGLRVC